MPERDRINAQKNAQKRDAIPSPDCIVNRHDAICSSWNIRADTYPDLFFPEITVAQLAKEFPVLTG